ncbi:MAG TPA: ABC transporter permease [Dictyobacter sp.]|jgi:ABC-type dipeptide/oligopeptide/nickel transport system permease component|nr:ABC transporter permease [Dictyobacter sp.]
MVQFLVKRLIGLIFVLIGVTFITFMMGYWSPITPVQILMGNHFDPQLYNQLMHQYGLDLPWYQQYYNFLVNLIHLNFGQSYQHRGESVWSIIAQGVPITLELGFWGLILQFVIGVPLGILSALKANTWIDTANMGTLLFLYAIPVFVLAVFVRVVIVWLDLNAGANWPPTGWGTPWAYDWTDLQYKIAPILVFAIGGAAYIARMARTSFLEVFRQDYIRTARAKGLIERIVIYRHAFRNALIPLVTIFGLSIGFLVTGSFFIENIFNIPGIANTTIVSVTGQDFPVIQGTTVILAVFVVLGNLISDILYTIIDPRIKY